MNRSMRHHDCLWRMDRLVSPDSAANEPGAVANEPGESTIEPGWAANEPGFREGTRADSLSRAVWKEVSRQGLGVATRDGARALAWLAVGVEPAVPNEPGRRLTGGRI